MLLSPLEISSYLRAVVSDPLVCMTLVHSLCVTAGLLCPILFNVIFDVLDIREHSLIAAAGYGMGYLAFEKLVITAELREGASDRHTERLQEVISRRGYETVEEFMNATAASRLFSDCKLIVPALKSFADSFSVGAKRIALSEVPSIAPESKFSVQPKGASGDRSHLGEDTVCSICMRTIEEGDIIRRLPGCNHVYHMKEIDQWLSR